MTLRTTPASIHALTGAGLADVLAERVRQIDVEGYTRDHDAEHHPGELALAAASYLTTAMDQLHGHLYPAGEQPDTWPWQRHYWKPGTARENLVKAIALGLATLDRLDAVGTEIAKARELWDAAQ